MRYNIIRKRDKGGNKNDALARRFYDMCEDVKNSRNTEDLNYHLGVACGFATGLFLSNLVDIDCYTAMHDCINNVREQCKLWRCCL